MTTNLKRGCLILLMMVLLVLPSLSLANNNYYIIPDSNTRELTREELWGYQYDTLLYAFNEIYARHGYRFETGSRCYTWFIQMPWYRPNMNETSDNHDATYRQCSSLENRNVALIKSVRQEMRDRGTLNSGGIGMPLPPPANVNKPRGFEYADLREGQKLAVYSAPSYSAYRANNGKAACSTNGPVYAMGWDSGWLLMLYEADAAGQYRVGYVDGAQIQGSMPNFEVLFWDGSLCQVLYDANLTDDPAQTGKPLAYLRAGTTVRYLTTMYNNIAWDYIETSINGQPARGFIPNGYLSITGADITENGGDG